MPGSVMLVVRDTDAPLTPLTALPRPGALQRQSQLGLPRKRYLGDDELTAVSTENQSDA